MNNKPKCLVSRWMTPDGTILQSKNRHDFVCYKDNEGKHYFVDGGLDYQRTSGDLTSLCLCEGADHKEVRKYFMWGSHGGMGTTIWRSPSELTTEHIRAILETQTQVPLYIKKVFQDELIYRDQQEGTTDAQD
jgi:hypothetical protein